MQAAKRVAVNTGFLYMRMAITVFISLYSTRLILQALGSEDFGLFNLVGGAILMLGFLNASMTEATQRFMSLAQGSGEFGKLKRILNVSIVLHIIIALILLIILETAGYFLINHVFNIPADRLHATYLIYQFMVFSTLLSVLSVPFDAIINAHENFFMFAIMGVLEAIAKLLIAYSILEGSGDKLILYGFLTAVSSILLLISRVVYCWRKYDECNISIRANFDYTVMKNMTSFAGWSFLGYSTSMIAFYGQGIVLNIFFGAVVNAAHGIANQISGQLGTLAHTMMRALNPTIAKSEGAGDRDLMIKAAMIGSKISFFLLMFIYVPVLIEMPFILHIWLKGIPEFTIIFCQLLLIRNIIEQLFLTLVTSIAAVGNIRKFQIFSAVLSLFPLLVAYLLFKHGFAPYSLYFVYIIYSLLTSVNILYFSHKTFDLSISLFLKEVILRCIGSFSIVFIISSIPAFALSEGFVRLLAVISLSFVSFLLMVWVIGFSRAEKDLARHLGSKLYREMLLVKRRFTSSLV
jgi:O-antigen/teichoic acid export membrane protein